MLQTRRHTRYESEDSVNESGPKMLFPAGPEIFDKIGAPGSKALIKT